MQIMIQKDVNLLLLINRLGVNAKDGKHRKVSNRMLHKINVSDIDTVCYGMDKVVTVWTFLSNIDAYLLRHQYRPFVTYGQKHNLLVALTVILFSSGAHGLIFKPFPILKICYGMDNI